MILLTAILLAAQPATPQRRTVRPRRSAVVATVRPTADWLKGLWVADADKGDAMEGCADWKAVFYQADGHYLHGDSVGRWSLAGDKLRRQPVTFVEGGGDDEQAAGAPRVSRIVRLSNDRHREVTADGKATLYLRCPRPETPVAR